MDYMEMRARHYSQSKNSIWCDFGYDAASGKEEKKLNKWWLWILIWVIGNMRRTSTIIWDIYGFKKWSDLSKKKNYQEWAETLLKHSDHPCVWSNLNAIVQSIQHCNQQQPPLHNPANKQTLHSEFKKQSRKKERMAMRYRSVFSFSSNE